MIHAIHKRFLDQITATANTLTEGPDEVLAGDQAFAAAYLSGVPFDSKYQDRQLTMTTEPCAAVRVGGKVTVYRKKERT